MANPIATATLLHSIVRHSAEHGRTFLFLSDDLPAACGMDAPRFLNQSSA
jgi:hypothetical protein